MLDSPIGWSLRKRQRKQNKQPRFFRTEPLILNSCRSLDYARGNEPIIYFTDLCKPIETCIYARKKHPFASYPAAKHPNASNLRLQTYDKTQWTGVDEFPFLLRYTIPCPAVGINAHP